MKILLLFFLFSFNLCVCQENQLEDFFKDPISQFNTLSDLHQLYLELYYFKKITENCGIKEEILTSKAYQYLKSNPRVLNYISLTTAKTIEKYLSSIDLQETNIKIYELIYTNLRNKDIKKWFPEPFLFKFDK